VIELSNGVPWARFKQIINTTTINPKVNIPSTMGAKNFKTIKTTAMMPIIGSKEFIIENIPPEIL